MLVKWKEENELISSFAIDVITEPVKIGEVNLTHFEREFDASVR